MIIEYKENNKVFDPQSVYYVRENKDGEFGFLFVLNPERMMFFVSERGEMCYMEPELWKPKNFDIIANVTDKLYITSIA